MASIERRIGKDGLERFRVKVRIKGSPERTATFHTIEDAEKWANQLERNINVKKNHRIIVREKQRGKPENIEHIMLALPIDLANKVKTVAPRGHRSEFIIELLENYFKNNFIISPKVIEVKRIARVKQIPNLYPAFNESSLRWAIHNKKKNGFNVCIKKIGNRILIDLDEFEKWLGGNAA